MKSNLPTKLDGIKRRIVKKWPPLENCQKHKDYGIRRKLDTSILLHVLSFFLLTYSLKSTRNLEFIFSIWQKKLLNHAIKNVVMSVPNTMHLEIVNIVYTLNSACKDDHNKKR